MIIATIIVVAILTGLIFILAIVAFSSFLKTEKQAINAGQRDEEIRRELQKEKKKSSKIINILSTALSVSIIAVLISLTTVAVVYKNSGSQFLYKEHTCLVIASNSMDGYYSSEYKLELPEDAYKQQFGVGDILDFKSVSDDAELKLYDVYGYKLSSGRIITHRLIGFTQDGKYIFRGDNTGGRDNYVYRSQIVLHYTGLKIKRIGLFVLFSQSGFGLYSLISVILVYILCDSFLHKYSKLIQERQKLITYPWGDWHED